MCLVARATSSQNVTLTGSIDCSEKSGCRASHGFNVVIRLREHVRPIIRRFDNLLAAFPNHHARLNIQRSCPNSAESDVCQSLPQSPSVNTLRFRDPKSMHLRSPQDFARLYADGYRAGDDHMLVFAMANEQSVNRLGLSISRKHGTAVRRNRKRRRIRDAFRRLQHDLPQGYDLVVIPRHRDDSTLQDYRNSLRKLVRKLAKRITSPPQSDSESTGDGGVNV
jgi:ribonuclease P protein component